MEFLTFRNVEDIEQYGDLYSDIVACVDAAFGRAMPRIEMSTSLITDYAIVVRDDERSQVIAYASMRFHPAQKRIPEAAEDETLASLQAGIVRPDYQGQGLYRELNRRRIARVTETQCRYLTTATQNPRVEHGLRQALEDSVKAGRLAWFTLERQIREGLYGRKISNYDYPRENTPFADLDLEAGDAFHLTFTLHYVGDA